MNYPTPSVGRQVWYYPATGDKLESDPIPWAATVIKVEGPSWEHSSYSPVNLLAINPDTGEQFFVSDVVHSPHPLAKRDCFSWMPYQLGQHEQQLAKVQAAEKARWHTANPVPASVVTGQSVLSGQVSINGDNQCLVTRSR